MESTSLRLLGVELARVEALGSTFFGFEEFLSALALMVLAWTIADTRYRFRLKTAPIPLETITFPTIAVVGVLILLTDLWQAERWFVPVGYLLTPALWRAILAGTFLSVFLTWLWYGFVRPPRFSARNASRFLRELYRAVLAGSPAELAILADELVRSMPELVRLSFAPTMSMRAEASRLEPPVARPVEAEIANQVLLLIADVRFCRVVVASAPVMAHALFREVTKQERYGSPIETFARNLVSAAVENPESFLYHETEGYFTGLLGYHKPLSHAIFGDPMIIHTIPRLFDADYRMRREWNVDQWNGYARAVLVALRSHTAAKRAPEPFAILTAIGNLPEVTQRIPELRGDPERGWRGDSHERVRVVSQFVNDALELLDQVPLSPAQARGLMKAAHGFDIYSRLAKLIVELVEEVAWVDRPRDLCWSLQHNAVWGEIFGRLQTPGAAARLVHRIALRAILREIARMREFANYKGARLLALAINIAWITSTGKRSEDEVDWFYRALKSWVRENFARLYAENPEIARASLVESFEFDPARNFIVRTDRADGLRLHSRRMMFRVNPL